MLENIGTLETAYMMFENNFLIIC